MKSRSFLAALVALVLAASVMTTVANAAPNTPAPKAQPAVQQVRCPVTGDIVKDPATAQKSVYKGKTYYFCCPACKPKFDADPEKYVGKAAPEKPMHTPDGGHGGDHPVY